MVINLRFAHPQKAGERNFFHSVSRNLWEVIISGPVQGEGGGKKFRDFCVRTLWMAPYGSVRCRANRYEQECRVLRAGNLELTTCVNGQILVEAGTIAKYVAFSIGIAA